MPETTDHAATLAWIAERRQWRCDRCSQWAWTRAGDWLDRFSRCFCGRDEPSSLSDAANLDEAQRMNTLQRGQPNG